VILRNDDPRLQHMMPKVTRFSRAAPHSRLRLASQPEDNISEECCLEHRRDIRYMNSSISSSQHTHLLSAQIDSTRFYPGQITHEGSKKESQESFHPERRRSECSLPHDCERHDRKTIPLLDLSAVASLSKLEHLSTRDAGYTEYLRNEELCRTLRDTTDLSRLRSLDFGLENPEIFFKTFTGHLPNLRGLQFGVVSDSSVELAKDFINSLTLTSLHIDSPKRGFDVLWPACYKHKDTLRTLVLGPTWNAYGSIDYLDDGLLETVSSTFPKLERLGWSIQFSDIVSIPFPHGLIGFRAYVYTQMNESALPVLSKMNLRKLDLYMDLHHGDSEFSDALQGNVMDGSNNPPLKRSESIAAATRIADTISQNQEDPLEGLTLRISRGFYADRFQPYNGYTAFQLRRKV
jgi:hypothetical protein